ncbi:succinylglutamate desuccinylase/aspartoacylase family protein [Halococcoides cellulosivorans]|uniref:Deacylase n=1 Tax=Halococcoides cellulosivorans TaxID=1679096 RepID=A0A2R4X3C4_9EURY|nr:succinylglutamate desuccinylase/aspartoacylase family protein [Halococcoides cellulosivorans]AWB28301.1 deacylase [Halococcoides cellulosivorans]
MISLGSAAAAPGEVATGRLPIGETRDGSSVGLPVAVVNGAEAGETLYLQAASDGDEANGVGVVREFVPRIDPAALRGAILVVGIVNYHGFQAGEHRNPLDDTKTNRAYPGDDAGTTSERIAATTFEAASRADYIVDLHQGSTSRMIHEVRVRCGRHHRMHDACLDLARAFDAGTILDQKGPEGQLARVGPDEGIPTIDPELGGAVGIDPASVEVGVQGLMNVCRSYDFLPGETSPGEQTCARDFDQYVAPAGGIVEFGAEPGETVAAGDRLFRVTDVFGSEKAVVTANTGGLFWRTRRLAQVGTGEYVCSVGTDLRTC